MFRNCGMLFRPVDSPYAQEKLKEKLDARGGRAPAGQKEVGLNELDLLVGDVLYFNSRVCSAFVVGPNSGTVCFFWRSL